MQMDFKDDIRQAFVISKNEIKKFISGKKFLIFGILVLLIILLETIIPYVFNAPYESKDALCASFVSFAVLIVELAGVLFTATSLVSEFEDRTALVLFTKPVNKWSIFVGKLMASMIAVGAFILIYYGYTALFSFTASGDLNTVAFCQSLVLALFMMFAVCGVSMLFSSFAKKGSTASILTLVFFVLIIGLVTTLLSTMAHIDTWWSIDTASGFVTYVLQGTYPVIIDVSPYIDYIPVVTEDIVKALGVMIIWGVVTNIIAFFIFRKRDF